MFVPLRPMSHLTQDMNSYSIPYCTKTWGQNTPTENRYVDNHRQNHQPPPRHRHRHRITTVSSPERFDPRHPPEKHRGHYKLGRELGRGKFAITSLCRHKSTGKKFACKSIPKRKLVTESEKQDSKERCASGDGVLRRRELFEKMKSKGRFSERTAARIIGCAIASFHGGYASRFEAGEFMLAKKGRLGLGFLPCFGDYSRLKAIDFGLSAYIDEGKPNQEKVGTAFYVAPEVLRRQAYGKEVDIWSAGVILYMLLTGVPPFYGEKEKEIFDAILNAEKVLDMDSHPWPSISNNARELVRKMLSVDPKKRPTASDVLKDKWMVENGEDPDNQIDSELLARMKHFKALNEFKKLALKIIADIIPHEELEGLEAMFRNMDTDENKVISVEELGSSLARLGSDLSSEEVQLISEAADADGNGCIDYNEFITAMMNFQRFHKKEHLDKAFQHFDKDKNGFISKGELKLALEEYKLKKETIEDIVSEVDTNKDGVISFEEFCAMIRS
ncbi:hypothetical protein OSB04_015338 [Centaurea solstitialis]|uniref:Calcium-dependent protein kinase n=1 Tax=Centaurea solstitialis TaxID=347529 RepID=A0AA38SZ07_9ASTR|nr:hypothetical protein OSB04_015338 [Centaurea solstitialis]